MKILCVHPNFELYGSDRSFASAVDALRKAHPAAVISCLFPCEGPILRLPPLDTLPHTSRHMVILRRRRLVQRTVLDAIKHIKAFWQAYRDLRDHEVVYVNTIIGIDFILMARLARRRVVIHVREIPVGIAAKVFCRLLVWSKAVLIFNSEATRRAFDLPIQTVAHVIHNAVEDAGDDAVPAIPHDGALRVLVIGRLNHWKGQEHLIDAANLLKARGRHIDVRIVGGTFDNQDDVRQRLLNRINALDVGDRVHVEPFTPNPCEHYTWADVVVVPSRLPEPFGRVAVEAMTHRRPVVASRHGGLVEIVVDGETGLFFTPGSAEDLSAALIPFLDNRDLVRQFGEAGRSRFASCFSLEHFNAAFISAMSDVIH